MSGSAMNRKYTMDVAMVRERVDHIRTVMSHDKRQEIVDMAGLDLSEAVLQAIADKTCADPQACAKAALEWRT